MQYSAGTCLSHHVSLFRNIEAQSQCRTELGAYTGGRVGTAPRLAVDFLASSYSVSILPRSSFRIPPGNGTHDRRQWRLCRNGTRFGHMF